MVTKLFVLAIDIISLSKYIKMKMQYKNLLVKCLKKLSVVISEGNKRHFRKAS